MRLISGRVLLVLASVALFFGALTLYVRATILDEREFADRATATLEDSDVRQVVSRRIVNIVAVDFYDEGDLIGAVDALNRVSPR